MFLLINKPAGPTSHDIIDRLRKITGIKKIGHAGTLDPFAQGLLLVAIGRQSTKQLVKFVGLDKEYLATLKLGASSDTYDKTGKISAVLNQQANISRKLTTQTLIDFIGRQQQLPPPFSAKKIHGKKAYELARQGIQPKLKPQKITIHNIQLIAQQLDKNLLTIRVVCSSGTYIRSLAHDIGLKLGCGAYLTELIRTKIGPYSLDKATKINHLNPQNWRDHIFMPMI